LAACYSLLALKLASALRLLGIHRPFSGHALRLLFLRKFVNKRVLIRFGLTSAPGGLVGALRLIPFNTCMTITWMLMILAGTLGLSGYRRDSDSVVPAVGLMGRSPLFCGLVGNQGRYPLGALLGFNWIKTCL
jgi:hypothetical protein